jgi:hypothetical protein
MSLYNPLMGEGFVPAYQISSTPWVTSSLVALGEIKQYTFPYVTRFVNIQNVATGSGDVINVAFTSRGFQTGNYFTLKQNTTLNADIRTDRIFISGSLGTNIKHEVLAGLTGVFAAQFQIITGSSGFQGVG